MGSLGFLKPLGGRKPKKENLERNKVRGLRGGVDVEIVGWVVDALRCEMAKPYALRFFKGGGDK